MWGQEKGDSYSFLSILTEHLLPVLVMGAGGLRVSCYPCSMGDGHKNGSGGDVVVRAVRERPMSNPNLPTSPPCKPDI